MSVALPAATGIALTTAAGFRVFVPLLAAGVAAATGELAGSLSLPLVALLLPIAVIAIVVQRRRRD